MHETFCSKIGAKSNLLSSVKTTVSFRSPTSVLSGFFFFFFFFMIHVGEQHGAAFFCHGSFYRYSCVCFFSIGCNRFEVTLEKSNKNFSKKIQQVSHDIDV